MSFFASVEMAPGDPILGLTEAFVADPRPGKINLGVGIYCDEQGKIPLMKAVRDVEQALAKAENPRGYLPINGLKAYNELTQQLLFGADSPLLAEGRVATAQTIGGSAALRVAADLLKQTAGAGAKIAISNPSWG
ncbi:MAG: aminotransferase class I/II-fold pyridoxal phosphate-dependent enzyme, partial [Burkholderiales bacterium]